MLASSSVVFGNRNERATLCAARRRVEQAVGGVAPLQIVELGQRRHAAAKGCVGRHVGDRLTAVPQRGWALAQARQEVRTAARAVSFWRSREHHSGAGFAGGCRRGKGCRDLCELRLAKLRAEMPNSVEQLDGLEVFAGALGVDVAAGIEAILLEEHERQPPVALGDQLAATAAVSTARRRALGAVQARHAAVLDAEPGGGGERFDLDLSLGWCRALRFEERLGSRVGAARQVKPQRHLAVAECIRLALAEPELAFGDRLVAAAAFGAAARGGFDDVCHVEIIERGRAARCLGAPC